MALNTSLFSFQGKMRRLPYAAAALAIFLGQYLLVVVLFQRQGAWPQDDWRFLAAPLRGLVDLPGAPPLSLSIAFALMILISWALAVLSFRRAADAGANRWIAAFSMAPVIQVGAILYLSVAPSRDPAPVPEPGARTLDWITAVQGVLAGAGLTLLSVATAALLFGSYGFGMFVLSPILIGATTAFVANRKGDIGWPATERLTRYALLLGGIGLLVTALEGVVCIVLCAPLAIGMGWFGAVLGQAITLAGNRCNSLMGIALLPMVFASEAVLPAATSFVTQESIEIAAPPDAVWRSLVDMRTIATPPSLPFRWGIAYPLRGEIEGEGVGAIRRGTFSTGVALERVTEWRKDRKLAFVLFQDPPAMRELSPYRNVHAPHVQGYFRTTATSFEIVPLAAGRSRLVERTEHELRLDPVLYWMPFARWMIRENNSRVLNHIRLQAELRQAS
jgi:uncharacterized membrane protein YhaH (DUF805 family)